MLVKCTLEKRYGYFPLKGKIKYRPKWQRDEMANLYSIRPCRCTPLFHSKTGDSVVSGYQIHNNDQTQLLVILHAGNSKKLAGETYIDLGSLIEKENIQNCVKRDLTLPLEKCPDPKGCINVILEMNFLQQSNDEQQSIYEQSSSKLSTLSYADSPRSSQKVLFHNNYSGNKSDEVSSLKRQLAEVY